MARAQQATFHLFAHLPAELRIQIWQLCLPRRRVLELDNGSNELGIGGVNACMHTVQTTRANASLPILSRVNREARSLVLESWTRLPEPPQDAAWNDGAQHAKLKGQWIDIHKVQYDVHLAWPFGVEYEAQRDGNQLRILLWAAAQMRKSRASFSWTSMLDLPIIDGELSQRELIRILSQRDEWTVVMLEAVIVHSAPNALQRTDLFGHLGDAPVQIVSDTDSRLAAFLDLQRVKGFSLSHVWPVDEVPQAIRWNRYMEFEGEFEGLFANEGHATKPKIRRAVMFKLCTRCQLPSYRYA
jgi:hypothetical protein